jgi:hypothetical protein
MLVCFPPGIGVFYSSVIPLVVCILLQPPSQPPSQPPLQPPALYSLLPLKPNLSLLSTAVACHLAWLYCWAIQPHFCFIHSTAFPFSLALPLPSSYYLAFRGCGSHVLGCVSGIHKRAFWGC